MTKVLQAELATLAREKEHLEREHKGKFVLIQGDEVIDAFDAFETAADEGLNRFGRKPFLIRQIGEEAVELPPAVIYGLTRANPSN